MNKCTLLFLAAATAALAQEQPVQDSPLVAAAKRSNRLGKKPAMVITNETLKSSGAKAHVTTTASQPALPAAQASKPVAPAATAPKPKKRAATKKGPADQPRDDAEIPEDDPGRGDLVQCTGCLPIIEPVLASLPLQPAELSKNPPNVVAPKAAPVVAPRPPENKKP